MITLKMEGSGDNNFKEGKTPNNSSNDDIQYPLIRTALNSVLISDCFFLHFSLQIRDRIFKKS